MKKELIDRNKRLLNELQDDIEFCNDMGLSRTCVKDDLNEIRTSIDEIKDYETPEEILEYTMKDTNKMHQLICLSNCTTCKCTKCTEKCNICKSICGGNFYVIDCCKDIVMFGTKVNSKIYFAHKSLSLDADKNYYKYLLVMDKSDYNENDLNNVVLNQCVSYSISKNSNGEYKTPYYYNKLHVDEVASKIYTESRDDISFLINTNLFQCNIICYKDNLCIDNIIDSRGEILFDSDIMVEGSHSFTFYDSGRKCFDNVIDSDEDKINRKQYFKHTVESCILLGVFAFSLYLLFK